MKGPKFTFILLLIVNLLFQSNVQLFSLAPTKQKQFSYESFIEEKFLEHIVKNSKLSFPKKISFKFISSTTKKKKQILKINILKIKKQIGEINIVIQNNNMTKITIKELNSRNKDIFNKNRIIKLQSEFFRSKLSKNKLSFGIFALGLTLIGVVGGIALHSFNNPTVPERPVEIVQSQEHVKPQMRKFHSEEQVLDYLFEINNYMLSCPQKNQIKSMLNRVKNKEFPLFLLKGDSPSDPWLSINDDVDAKGLKVNIRFLENAGPNSLAMFLSHEVQHITKNQKEFGKLYRNQINNIKSNPNMTIERIIGTYQMLLNYMIKNEMSADYAAYKYYKLALKHRHNEVMNENRFYYSKLFLSRLRTMDENNIPVNYSNLTIEQLRELLLMQLHHSIRKIKQEGEIIRTLLDIGAQLQAQIPDFPVQYPFPYKGEDANQVDSQFLNDLYKYPKKHFIRILYKNYSEEEQNKQEKRFNNGKGLFKFLFPHFPEPFMIYKKSGSLFPYILPNVPPIESLPGNIQNSNPIRIAS
ncbi:hypothetical protein BVX93_01645 [bacterium B13(2017)]|nr:hypothetical protein BVX93_01645 [bacterium B13(2017)]